MTVNLECSFNGCSYHANSLTGFVKHSRLHQGSGNYKINCPVVQCPLKFKFTKSLTKHLKRSHGSMKQQVIQTEEIRYKCELLSCYGKELFSVNDIKHHLRDHCKRHETVTCVFSNCFQVYNCQEKLRNHFFYKHRNSTASDIKATNYFTPPLLVDVPEVIIAEDIEVNISTDEENESPQG